RSVSGIGLSVVYVEFEWGSEIFRNRQQIAERLNLVREQLPQGIVPQMGPISSIMGEILLIALPADPDKVSPMQVREYADWVMRPRLLTIPGVAQVIPIGGQVKQYRVEPDPARLQAVGVSLSELETALKNFGGNTAGGFVDAGGREYLIRNIGRTTRLVDLQNQPVATRNGQPILLRQVAAVTFAPGVKRGDASFKGKPAVILSVQKQPTADSVELTRAVEQAMAEMGKSLPQGVDTPQFLFKQANFIEASVRNVEEALRDGAIMVAVILFLFLANFRTTFISLTAIPVSLLVTALVFSYFGLSINTMTLGGLAIAIGELVDDAVVDVENVLRRLRENRTLPNPRSALEVIAAASKEVRSGVVYATLIVVLVFIPLFALPGIEGRLFTPLGVAYIVSILASMAVAMTITPVLCYYLLPKMKHIDHGDSALVRKLKAWDERLLNWSFDRARALLIGAVAVVVVALASIPFFAKSFLPPFNEGTLTVNVVLNPGSSLAESNQIG
uniref:efflux RND transporter permease subunit n=1 Tax=Accumulibacter sp. TaxID=2053492 RepID=UPI0035B214D7